MEKLSIAAFYQWRVLRDMNKAGESYEFLLHDVSSGLSGMPLLGNVYCHSGTFEDALTQHQEAVRLRPSSALSREALSADYIQLNRLEEAKAVIDKSFEEKIQYPAMHRRLYVIAFMRGDVRALAAGSRLGESEPRRRRGNIEIQIQARYFLEEHEKRKNSSSEARLAKRIQ